MSKTKSKNIEMITGDPKKAIIKLALPMMLSMLLIMMYNIADSIWVAGLGADALAAIGFITPLFMVLVGLGNGIGAGANSLIARYIGAGNIDEANNAGLHGILLAIIVSVIFTVIIEVFMVWHGPHHDAQKSTNTGLSAFNTSASKFSFVMCNAAISFSPFVVLLLFLLSNDYFTHFFIFICE